MNNITNSQLLNLFTELSKTDVVPTKFVGKYDFPDIVNQESEFLFYSYEVHYHHVKLNVRFQFNADTQCVESQLTFVGLENQKELNLLHDKNVLCPNSIEALKIVLATIKFCYIERKYNSIWFNIGSEVDTEWFKSKLTSKPMYCIDRKSSNIPILYYVDFENKIIERGNTIFKAKKITMVVSPESEGNYINFSIFCQLENGEFLEILSRNLDNCPSKDYIVTNIYRPELETIIATSEAMTSHAKTQLNLINPTNFTH